MPERIADDFDAIRARMAELAAERQAAIAGPIVYDSGTIIIGERGRELRWVLDRYGEVVRRLVPGNGG